MHLKLTFVKIKFIQKNVLFDQGKGLLNSFKKMYLRT